MAALLRYGVVGGCGLGLGYVSPVSTLIKWFPDRRGMAAGMAIMGFGGGAMIAAPAKEACIEAFYRAPDYLGPVSAVTLETRDGRRFARVGEQLREVVVVGPGEVGIHGRLLTAWSVAGVLGPLAITSLREHAAARAMQQLAETVSPAAFAARFGAPREQITLLIEQKTVTIAKLLELAPAGTVDPSCTLYNTTMQLMAGMLAVAFVANALVRPVADVRHLRNA